MQHTVELTIRIREEAESSSEAVRRVIGYLKDCGIYNVEVIDCWPEEYDEDFDGDYK